MSTKLTKYQNSPECFSVFIQKVVTSQTLISWSEKVSKVEKFTLHSFSLSAISAIKRKRGIMGKKYVKGFILEPILLPLGQISKMSSLCIYYFRIGGSYCLPPTLETKGLLARSCGVPVGRRSGGRLAMTLVATINVIIFFIFYFLFFSVVYFSHRRSARIKKLI